MPNSQITVSTGRYSVGEKLIAIAFHSSLFNSSAMINTNQFSLVELTVKEHHRVPDGYSRDRSLNHDGYILEGPGGSVFHNQYPTAHYQQMSDTGDRSFLKVIPKPVADDFRYFTLFTDFLENFQKDENNMKLPQELRERTSALKEVIMDLFRKQFPYKYVERQPVQFEKIGGGFEVHDDIQHFVILEHTAATGSALAIKHKV